MDEFQFLPTQASELGVTAPPVRRRTLTLGDGRTLSALEYGDPRTGDFAAPRITFLHGAGLNAHTWDTTVLALGRPALALDLAGHGDSSWREDAAYTARNLAADVAEAVSEWTQSPQVVVGQSLGGLTATALAASRPDLVEALVIVDITPGIDPNAGAAQIAAFFAGPTDWASRDDLVERAQQFGLGGSREATARGVFLNSRVRDDGRVEWKHHFARIANVLAADPAAAEAAHAQQTAARSLLTASGWDDLASVTAPLTLVRGERGFVSEHDAAVFLDHVPTAAVLTVPSGHNVQEELPAALAALVGDVAAD